MYRSASQALGLRKSPLFQDHPAQGSQHGSSKGEPPAGPGQSSEKRGSRLVFCFEVPPLDGQDEGKARVEAIEPAMLGHDGVACVCSNSLTVKRLRFVKLTSGLGYLSLREGGEPVPSGYPLRSQVGP